jgi:co-chaperonin GroES (HSP10)
MAVIQMRNSAAADKVLLKAIGDLSSFEVGNERVLIAIYRHEGVTKGGILTSTKTEDESDYQGKVGLVLKVGPCVNPEGRELTRGFAISVGDWIVVNPSDGLSMHAGAHGSKVMLRMLPEKVIHMRVPRPDVVW